MGEARPAAWWNGDQQAFHGKLFFDPENCFGDRVPSKFDAQGKVAIFQRGGCTTFAQKEANAHRAGAAVMLVVQKPQAACRTIRMTATKLVTNAEPTLPAAMVSEADGNRLIQLAALRTRIKLVGARNR